MDVILTHEILDMSVVFTNETVYAPLARTSYAYLLYLNNKKTTGDVPITVPVLDYYADIKWTFTGLVDGYYKAELLIIPDFNKIVSTYFSGNHGETQPLNIPIGIVTFYNGVFYKSIKVITGTANFLTPDIDHTNWEEIDITSISNVYNEELNNTFPQQVQVFYGFDELVYYNNLILSFINKSKEITKTCSICDNPEIELLRCLRDTYESVELATAASNYSGAQLIIESTQNLHNCCSC